jgi:cytochrome c peroxidase
MTTILTFPKRFPADLASAELRAAQDASRPELVAHFEQVFNKTLYDTAHLSRDAIVEALAQETVSWVEQYEAFMSEEAPPCSG